MNSKQKLEKQLLQQLLDEQGLSGKIYGIQGAEIELTDDERRQVSISAYTLASLIKKEVPSRKKGNSIELKVGQDKALIIDLCTLEVLYVDDELGEETYLDRVTFAEEE